MENTPSRYRYFENLETTIKFALAIYVMLLLLGLFVNIIGEDVLAGQAFNKGIAFVIVSALLTGGLFIGLYYSIGKIHWLGELHIQLDRKLFGFLLKSNDTIFTTLVTALPQGEQQEFHNLHSDKKGALAQTIFNNLPNDLQLFDSLLRSGIFRLWIAYWVTIYGTSTFAALTIASFVAAWIRMDHYGKSFFGINWGLALLHLALSLYLGRQLVRKTRTTVNGIVASHEEEIARALRNNIA